MTNFKFKKKYGQNFLKDENISNKIVSAINPTEKDLIIEIGPGAGAITKKLKKYNSKLLAFEIDTETKKYLKPLEDNKTKIIYEDFLEANIQETLKTYEYENLYIIGNLPYYITTPIIEKIIDTKIDPKECVIMVQKEVADRFLASPHTKQYGYMTVILNYNFNLTRIIEVDKTKFNPIPKVDSTVIKLERREKEEVDYQKFQAFLKEAFGHKRKTINNNIKTYDKDKIKNILEQNGYTLSCRPEEIDYKTYIDIVKNL